MCRGRGRYSLLLTGLCGLSVNGVSTKRSPHRIYFQNPFQSPFPTITYLVRQLIKTRKGCLSFPSNMTDDLTMQTMEVRNSRKKIKTLKSYANLPSAVSRFTVRSSSYAPLYFDGRRFRGNYQSSFPYFRYLLCPFYASFLGENL